jgi:hypothetical protein
LSDIPKALRDAVVSRAGDRCEYCRIPSRGQIAWFPIDHVVPRNAGGETTVENLALACPRCNGHKWAFETGIDPETQSELGLFNPRADSWGDHFSWEVVEGLPTITGRTAVGRATMERLKRNTPEVLEIRQLLMSLGIEIIV